METRRDWPGVERLSMLIERGPRGLQSELARQIGVGRSRMSKIKMGQASPSPRELVEMCRFLGVSADWLLGLSDEVDGASREAEAGESAESDRAESEPDVGSEQFKKEEFEGLREGLEIALRSVAAIQERLGNDGDN